MNGFTQLSKTEWNRLLSQSMSAKQAADYLYSELPYRRFADVLSQVCPRGLRERLASALMEAGASQESADRTARNWLSGASIPKNRETIYRVAFSLRADAEGANRLLCAASDYGIHARDPVEVVYLFALSTGRDYACAQRLIDACSRSAKDALNQGATTKLLGDQLRAIDTDEDFLAWHAAHREDFALLHGTARAVFLQNLNHLIGDGEDFSIEFLLSSAFRFSDSVPLDRDRSRLNPLQKILKQYWPNATTLKQMKEGRIDVTRKALILLYILCEGVTDEEYHEFEEDYITPRERLEAHAASIDSMLATCGMGVLDPRGPFDWLVLYCLCSGADETMGERMENVLACVFGSETESTAE